MKRLQQSLVELLDIAIFNFTLQCGLRATDKVRGDPVIEGVCAMFGDLLQLSKQETLKTFKEVSKLRLGNWQPGTIPTKETIQWVSSRLQFSKARGLIREIGGPSIPNSLLKESRGKLKLVERKVLCWRCKNPCQYCEGDIPIDILRSE